MEKLKEGINLLKAIVDSIDLGDNPLPFEVGRVDGIKISIQLLESKLEKESSK
jgi:hypothetical protein